MKTIKQLLATTLLMSLVLASCKKYEEGPALSLRSKKERIANVWKIDYAYDLRNNVNVTADYAGETWEFGKDGKFTERENGIVDNTGTWEFVNDKEKISIKIQLSTQQYDILKLKENELWLKDAKEELHLIPVN